MQTRVTDQLRPLLVVWLLLTLPIFCHHETAAALLGAIVGARGHAHLTPSPGADHADRGTAMALHAHAPAGAHDAAGDPSPTTRGDGPEWCAGHGTTSLLTAGQQSLAWASPTTLPVPPLLLARVARTPPTDPPTRTAPPLVPPPRLLA